MGTQFGQLFKNMDEAEQVGLDGWNTNDKMINFATQFAPQYRKLTKEESKAAAYAFLEGYDRYVDGQVLQVAEIGTLPPFSDNTKDLQLIDNDVMGEYLDHYHNFIYEELNKRDRDYTTDEGKLKHSEFDLAPINSIISRDKKDIERHC